MRDLSVKGIARKYGSRTGTISLKEWLKAPDTISDDGTIVISLWNLPSLRNSLESIASKERYLGKTQNCPGLTYVETFCDAIIGLLIGGIPGAVIGGLWGYHQGYLVRWPVKFRQTWTHITVRIRLNWTDPNYHINDRLARMDEWKNGIESAWGYKWGCERKRNEILCPLTFEVEWVEDNEHYQVWVLTGSNSTAFFLWWTQDSPETIRHEFGHMLGLPDEYAETRYPCPGQILPGEGTIMENHSDNVPKRMMEEFQKELDSELSEWISY